MSDKYPWQEKQNKRREDRRPKPKPRQPIKRNPAKFSKTDVTEEDKWFSDRAKEMTGICINCGGKSIITRNMLRS